MNVIICADNKMGTMFNGRRQSRDRVLYEKVISVIEGSRLLLRPYSYELFEDFNVEINIDDNFLKMAKNGDFCFSEGDELAPFEDKIEAVILFRWNRDYPSDVKMDIDLTKGWCLTYTEDFAGNSHDKITMERYERV